MIIMTGATGALAAQRSADGPAFDGPVTLTAGAAVTFSDIAAMASELTGREIRRVVVDDETWVAEQVAQGAPEPMARFTLGTFQSAREGRFAGVDPLLGDLIGREPRTVRDLLAERAASRCEPGLTRVGALSSSTSLNRYSTSSPRWRER
jgi:NAD(P)H dehydrogenase (quinone)